VRYTALDLERARPITPTHVVASAPDRRGYRIAGPILLSFGIAAFTGAVSVFAIDGSSRCEYASSCWRGLLSGVIGAPLATAGLGLGIPGAFLTHRGYHDDIERRADRVFLDVDPKLAARR
jgi:hypothetical protein